MINRKLMFVEWLDHVSFTEAHWREEWEYDDMGPIKCQSVGWIIKEDEHCIVLVQTRNQPIDLENDSEKYSGDICILKSAILMQKELKL